jgi:hypothetical protein
MARKHGLLIAEEVSETATGHVPVRSPHPSPSPRRRQILAARSAAAQPTQPSVQPPIAPRPPIHRRRRSLPERVILRTRLDNLTPIESTVLQALARFGSATPRDIVRNVRGVEDAHAILNRLVELGLASRRADDRRGKGRRAQWVYSVSTQFAMGLGWP